MPPASPSALPQRLLDLRGERCPYTFIKARLAIEELSCGEVLEVLLDFAPAFQRVPASLGVLGHETLGSWAAEGGGKRFRFRRGDATP